VRDRLLQLRVVAAVDSQLPLALGDDDRSCAPRDQQGRLELARGKVDAVRRQLRDAVRDDRPREVDRLAARAAQWDLCNEGHAIQNRTPKCKLATMSELTQSRLRV
jgi:hypothetical protein